MNIRQRLKKLEGSRKAEIHLVAVMSNQSKEDALRERFGEQGPPEGDEVLFVHFRF